MFQISSRKIIGLLQFRLMRIDILYIYILQIIIKCDWALNEKCLATSQVYCILCFWVEHKLTEHLPLFCDFPSIFPSVTFYVNKTIFTSYSVHLDLVIIRK